MKEFELISQYFKGRGVQRKDVQLGIGDDAALVTVPEGHQLAVTTDTLVEGVHFFSDICPKALGHRVLAVNFSDLAAMGAQPTWISIALTLPKIEPKWLEAFTEGMHSIAEYFNVQLIGGDTTQGPMTISVCAKGIVPNGKAITRSGANNGDWIYVTGPLGDAGLAIEHKLSNISLSDDDFKLVNQRFDYPSPRVAAGQVLRNFASAAIDVSDGLLADLGHICERSSVGASINIDKIPRSAVMNDVLSAKQQRRFLLSYGDDYELLFTVPAELAGALAINLKPYGVEPVCIGQVTANTTQIDLFENGEQVNYSGSGFEHFSQSSTN